MYSAKKTDREAVRREFAAALEACIDAAGRLLESLQAEKQALVDRDPDALECVLAEKAQRTDELAALDRERSRLATAAGFAEHHGDSDVSSPHGTQRDIAERWEQLQALIEGCAALNLANGNVIRVRQALVADRLKLIRGETRVAATYEQPGSARHRAAHRSLAQA